ncbi:MAG: helix-turn-helix transcriptional regulator [Bilifractor sp.]|nr:helix-turn-helix domain-containing protein [Lachnospiraceae bacterium]MDY2837819.1 helix-turn-helix transcriptional regulator [Bilifractor sp.]
MNTLPSNNLKKYRVRAGLTREKAAAAQIDSKTLYRYENNMQCPNVYTALRHAAYYHQTVSDLFPLESAEQNDQETANAAPESAAQDERENGRL